MEFELELPEHDEDFNAYAQSTERFKAMGLELVRSDTRNTNLIDYPCLPDITLKCSKCNYFIDVAKVKEHKKYHSSLQKLKLKHDVVLKDVEELLKRRNRQISKTQRDTPKNSAVNWHSLNIIDEAYEYLKANVEDTFSEFNDPETNPDTASVDSKSLGNSLDCVCAVGIASSANASWKSSMEDAYAYVDTLDGHADKSYFGLFDGYNGSVAAQVAASSLHKIILRELQKLDNKPESSSGDSQDQAASDPVDQERSLEVLLKLCEDKYSKLFPQKDRISEDDTLKSKFKNIFSDQMSDIFKKSYQLLDIVLSYNQEEQCKVRWSGCSALSILLQETSKDVSGDPDSSERDAPSEKGLLHIANAGNVQCILVRDNRSYRLTKDHSPKNSKECVRILASGGEISNNFHGQLVNGVQATTRGLGNHGDAKLKKMILAEPYTTCIKIDQYAQFVVMATQGVWEVFSDAEVALLLLKFLPCHQITLSRYMSPSTERLTSEQILQGLISPLNLNQSPSPTDHVSSMQGDVTDTDDNFEDSNPDVDFHKHLAECMSKHLVQAALLAGAKENISAIVILLPGAGV